MGISRSNKHIAQAGTYALTVREACAFSRLGKTSINELIHSGRLPSLKLAGRRLVLRADLVALLKNERKRALERVATPRPRRRTRNLSRRARGGTPGGTPAAGD